MDITQLESLVNDYQQAQPDAMQQKEPILQAERKTLTEAFLNAGDDEAKNRYVGEDGKRFQLLRRAGLQDLPRYPEGEKLAARILQKWDQTKTPGTLLAGMLMLHPRELPLPEHFRDITDWLRQDYADFLLSHTGVFNRIGEADQFAVFFAAAVELFHRSLVSDETFAGADEIRNLFVYKANFIQFYFNEKNLRETYRLRAEIMENWALRQKAPLSHLFPLRVSSQQKIKVGILSMHFMPQTEIYLLLSYFDRLPRETFNITLYSLRKSEHPLEEYCRSRTDSFVLLPDGAYPQRVDRIRNDDLDILLIGTNTSAVTNPIAIMAMFRMARIHVIVENSPVSTGFTHTDYYLSSLFNEPDEDAQEHYTEELYRVPGMLNYYAYHLDTDPRTVNLTRAQLGIPDNAVIYFSGANFFKILPDLSNVWSWIFSQVQNSYLVLMPFNPNWTQRYLSVPFINRVKAQMEQMGVDFNSRVRILNRVPTRADVHGVMGLCDIYLDSFPYAGACSLIDPLSVGLPIVCRAGKTMRGSLAAAMLRGAGLEDLIVNDAGEYVERAVALGRNPKLRERTRNHIRNTLSRYNPFFDTAVCGVKTGAAFADMADRRRRSEIYLLRQEPEVLKDRIEELSARLVKKGNLFFGNLADTELVRLLLVPYFKSLTEPVSFMADVGAGQGQFAVPFLNMGWKADLIESNPAYHAHLNALAQQLPGRVRLLSKAENLNSADMLRIGAAAGADIVSFLSDCLSRFSPRVIMIETVNQQPSVISQMKTRGYDALFFRYEGNQEHRLTGIFSGQMPDNQHTDHPGYLIFFRQEDIIFLATAVRLLEDFFPACERNRLKKITLKLK